MVDLLIQSGITAVALGVFYGAIKTEIKWINITLKRHEKKLDLLCPK